MKLKDLIFCLIYLAASLTGLTLIKAGEPAGDVKAIRIAGIPVTASMITGILFYGISFLIYIRVISRLQISLCLPVLAAVNSMITILIGVFLFQESLNRGQLIGIAVIIFGTMLVGLFSS